MLSLENVVLHLSAFEEGRIEGRRKDRRKVGRWEEGKVEGRRGVQIEGKEDGGNKGKRIDGKKKERQREGK